MQVFNRLVWTVALVMVGCSPTAPRNPIDTRADAALDVVADDRAPSECEAGRDCSDAGGPQDVVAPPVDAGAIACQADPACAALGQVCDRDRGVCVGCRTRADCAGESQVCTAQRCGRGVACTSSRQCPGQVCHATLGLCVDCGADGDCPADQQRRDATSRALEPAPRRASAATSASCASRPGWSASSARATTTALR